MDLGPWMEEGKERAKQRLAMYMAESSGPTGTAMMAMPPLALPVFKADYPDGVRVVVEAMKRGEALDYSGGWTVIRQEDEFTLVFEVQWVYPAARLVFVMPLPQYRVEVKAFTETPGIFAFAPSGSLSVDEIVFIDNVDVHVPKITLEVMEERGLL